MAPGLVHEDEGVAARSAALVPAIIVAAAGSVRAANTGDPFTFVPPEEEGDLVEILAVF